MKLNRGKEYVFYFCLGVERKQMFFCMVVVVYAMKGRKGTG